MLFDRLFLATALVTLVAICIMCAGSYTGSMLAMACFLGAAAVMIAVCWGLKPTYFSRIASTFLFLGFPLKFAATTAFGVMLIEPVGAFDGSASAWDETLIVSALGLTGLTLGHVITTLAPNFPSRRIQTTGSFRAWGLWLLVVSLVLTLGLLAINNYWAIYQIGVVPRVSLPGLVHAAISFGATWGAAIWIGAICYWLVEAGRLNRFTAVFIVFLVGFAAALSIGGRAQVLLYAIGAGLFLQTSHHLVRRTVSPKVWFGVAMAAVCLVSLSVAAVSLQRAFTFSSSVAEPIAIANDDSGPTDAQPPMTYQDSVRRYVGFLPQEISSLFIMRWLGLEGVMAVQAYPNKGTDLFAASLLERDEGVDSIYQRIARSNYQRLDGLNFQTLAGPIATGYYTGSIWMVLAFVAAISAILGLGEKALNAFLPYSLPVTIASAGLSYYFVQLTYPRYTGIFVAEVFLTLSAIALFGWLVVHPRHKGQQEPKS